MIIDAVRACKLSSLTNDFNYLKLPICAGPPTRRLARSLCHPLTARTQWTLWLQRRNRPARRGSCGGCGRRDGLRRDIHEFPVRIFGRACELRELRRKVSLLHRLNLGKAVHASDADAGILDESPPLGAGDGLDINLAQVAVQGRIALIPQQVLELARKALSSRGRVLVIPPDRPLDLLAPRTGGRFPSRAEPGCATSVRSRRVPRRSAPP